MKKQSRWNWFANGFHHIKSKNYHIFNKARQLGQNDCDIKRWFEAIDH